MSTPIDPADIAAVQATDALLDRLGLGTTTSEDRQDALVGALVALRTDLEEPGGDPGVDMARLLEVLGERPLYLVDGEEADEATELPIHLGRGAETDGRLVVDLTALAASSPDGLPESNIEPVPEPVGLAAFTARAARVADQLREKAPGHALLPAASVVALLVLGLSSGVSGVVTGDPMAPVSGVGRVLSALPGVSSDRSDVQAFQDKLSQAKDLAAKQQQDEAKTVLDQAEQKIDELPAAKQSDAAVALQQARQELGVQNPTASATPAPSVGPSVTTDASPTPTPTAPSDSPSASVTPTPSAPATTDSSGSGSSSDATS
ncbi:hypothetical protein ACIB24_13990 [Spongisporangium articulatum]|uniref:Anti-sigma-D factor RsdA sigma factor binding region domain-containing protein n=1 Tax=Spongisporangium articulatum TaxID=3362603 RepID=A0ABW8AP68_9ACTN